MGPSSITTPPSISTQSRVDQTGPQLRNQKALQEKLDLVKPQGTSTARSQQAETRNYQDSEQLIANAENQKDSQVRTGQKRGSLLDVSV